MSYEKYANTETKDEREARRDRVRTINSGRRGADGLTDAERALLDELKRAGYALSQGYPINERRAVAYFGNRVMEPAL